MAQTNSANSKLKGQTVHNVIAINAILSIDYDSVVHRKKKTNSNDFHEFDVIHSERNYFSDELLFCPLFHRRQRRDTQNIEVQPTKKKRNMKCETNKIAYLLVTHKNPIKNS